MVENFIYAFVLVQLIAIAILDVKYKKISNQWMILNLTLFGVFVFLFPSLYSVSFATMAYALTFLGVGFFLYLLRIMGAGDSKYLFSLFLLTPGVWQEAVFENLLISTMIIGGFNLLTTLIQNSERIMAYARSGYAAGIKKCFGGKFPFAPVILMAWIWLGVKF